MPVTDASNLLPITHICFGHAPAWMPSVLVFLKPLNRPLTHPYPLTALFGVPPTQNMPTTTQRVIAFTTLLARRSILLKWKHVSPPTHDRWIQELLQCINLEKIRFSLQGSLTLFHKTWTPLLLLINDLTINPDADEVWVNPVAGGGETFTSPFPYLPHTLTITLFVFSASSCNLQYRCFPGIYLYWLLTWRSIRIFM